MSETDKDLKFMERVRELEASSSKFVCQLSIGPIWSGPGVQAIFESMEKALDFMEEDGRVKRSNKKESMNAWRGETEEHWASVTLFKVIA